ncbi:MAG: 16S rRNA (cytidine(1402)-2'-O)-methyltransferase [Deltaproteobacteria bacterium]|jgi:16S rRNA (cytidine1402-2'-O)-methyltransferase|nr:16S rRNA (cytidine(1402)-2'-O)-methyltransferase [Deltaproteobacteria bacterium]
MTAKSPKNRPFPQTAKQKRKDGSEKSDRRPARAADLLEKGRAPVPESPCRLDAKGGFGAEGSPDETIAETAKAAENNPESSSKAALAAENDLESLSKTALAAENNLESLSKMARSKANDFFPDATPTTPGEPAIRRQAEAEPAEPLPPGLHLLPSPLGNLGDLSERFVSVLRRADLVAAEDTRRSLKILTYLGLKKPLWSYREDNHLKMAPKLLSFLGQGRSVALLSDAGAPGICDPGARLVSAVRGAGLSVHPLPGPSAVITALAASGFMASSFTFLGFLPHTAARRRAELEAVKNLDHPLVFFIPPHKLTSALAELLAVLGPRPAFLAREMTKLHEEYLLTSLPELLDDVSRCPRRGEITLVLGPLKASVSLPADALAEPRDSANDGSRPGQNPKFWPRAASSSGEGLDEEMAATLDAIWKEERSAKRTSAVVAAKFGLSRTEAYSLVNAWRNRKEEDIKEAAEEDACGGSDD